MLDGLQTIHEMVVTGGTGGNSLRTERIRCYHSPKNGGNRWDHPKDLLPLLPQKKKKW